MFDTRYAMFSCSYKYPRSALRKAPNDSCSNNLAGTDPRSTPADATNEFLYAVVLLGGTSIFVFPMRADLLTSLKSDKSDAYRGCGLRLSRIEYAVEPRKNERLVATVGHPNSIRN